MGLLQKLKSALGLDGTGSSESGRSGDVDVTVEREPSTEDEDAVKGTETASSGAAVETDDSATSDSEDDESETPSADEFETIADDTETADDGAEADTETADTDTETADTDTETADEGDAAETAQGATESVETDETGESEAAAGSTEPVTELNGIGPAYGDRLAGAGIETVGELAAADAAELADQIELGESRVAGWVDQATEY